MKTSVKILWVALFLFILGVVLYLSNEFKAHEGFRSNLPYYGPEGKAKIEYTVSDFSFTNQYNQTITKSTFDGTVWVTDFFFASCTGICPIMSNQMESVSTFFRKNPNVKFLSHTVDPLSDSIPVLLEYAKAHHADSATWHFVTGQSDSIYARARNAYFAAPPKDTTQAEDFVHSQIFTLIDPTGHIRGYYDGTNTTSMEKLKVDIGLLLKEFGLEKN